MIYKLKPIFKHRVWGGHMLPSFYGVNTDDSIGEAWILSCINSDNNIIQNNKTLKDLFLEDKNIVAKGWTGDFPILIKLIDARDDLSIQVHPKAKTEFWHILNKTPSTLKIGLNKDSNVQEVENAIKNSTITSLINTIEVKNGDSFLINPGTIHAICANTFLIEIQQSADVTYRLYDYDRVDSDGKTRPLHIKESLEAINYHKLNIENLNLNDNHLVSTKFFNVYKYCINNKQTFIADDSSFHSITVLEGNGIIKNENQSIPIKQYDTLFIPASSGKYEIEGNCTIVLTTL